jgi:hypothetical protein
MQFLQRMCKKFVFSKLNFSVCILLCINIVIFVFMFVNTTNHFIIYIIVVVIYYHSTTKYFNPLDHIQVVTV